MSAIVICTQNARCLPVLLASITFYIPHEVEVYLAGSDMMLPRHRTFNLPNTATNFGDAYNAAVNEAFERHNDVFLCNDDVVLTPYTFQTLLEDISSVEQETLGYMACRSDYARSLQNVRYRFQTDRFAMKHDSESHVICTAVIAPIFAYVKKDAWVDFPPINWYSDDIQCYDMISNGKKHYISRSYVHHVGSQTCGMNYEKCIEDSKPWILENRPEFALWFKTAS